MGIDPPGIVFTSREDQDQACVGEIGVDKESGWDGIANAVGDWKVDEHGRGEKLAGKREGRNPWGVWQGVWSEGSTGDVPALENKGGLKMKIINAVEVIDENEKMPWS